MTYPHIESQADYERYKEAFARGTKGFAITCSVPEYRHIYKCNHPDCEGRTFEHVTFDPEPDVAMGRCDGLWCNWDDATLVELDPEGDYDAGFSWAPCDLCNRALGGDRQHFALTNPDDSEPIYCRACNDCGYYAEYGCLDDMTMLDHNLV